MAQRNGTGNEKKSNPTNFSELQASTTGLTPVELMAEAQLRCNDELIKLFKKNLSNLEDHKALSERLAKLQAKIDGFTHDRDSIIAAWLGGFDQLAALASTANHLDGLKAIAAKQVGPKTAKAKGSRTSWTQEKVLEVLKSLQADGDGYVAGKAAMEALNCQNVDLLASRLALVKGELLAVPAGGGDAKEVNITKDGVKKTAGKRNTYKLAKKAILARLQS